MDDRITIVTTTNTGTETTTEDNHDKHYEVSMDDGTNGEFCNNEGGENTVFSQSESRAQDEVIRPADGPSDCPSGSFDPAGPGDPLGEPVVVHNLAGKGVTVVVVGDHPLTGWTSQSSTKLFLGTTSHCPVARTSYPMNTISQWRPRPESRLLIVVIYCLLLPPEPE